MSQAGDRKKGARRKAGDANIRGGNEVGRQPKVGGEEAGR